MMIARDTVQGSRRVQAPRPLFYARNSQKRSRLDSVDLPSRRKRPRPSLVTVDSAPLLEAKFRLLAAFERRFKE